MSFSREIGNTPRDGDFLARDHDNPVDGKARRLGAYETDGVRFERLGFKMADGTRYVATTTKLLDESRSTDVLNVSSAAWTTGDDGLNRREPLFLARKHGMESCFFSVAQNLFRLGNYEADVRNHLTMARHLVESGGYQPHHVVTSGISHGAMNGFGFSALGEEYGFRVLYGDYRAPCFPNHVANTNLWGNIQKLGNELEGLLKISTSVPPEALWRYPATLHLGPRGALRHLQDVPTLLGGRVGELVRTRLPEDAFGYVSMSDGDALSQAADWEDELDGHPLIIIDRHPGGSHLEECAAERATEGWKRRIGTIAAILADKQDREWIVAQDSTPTKGSSTQALYLLAAHQDPKTFLVYNLTDTAA